MIEKWLYTTAPNYYGGTSNADAQAYRVVTSPHYINNILYGTEENTVYKTYMHGGILNQYWELYPISGTELEDYYIRLIGLVDNSIHLRGYDIGYENKTISGKFRINDTLTGGALQGWRIPLNCEVLLQNGTRLFTNVIMASTVENRFTTYSYNGFVLQYVDNNDNVTAYQQIGSTVTEDVSYSTVGTIQENAILDFGETPQSIPSFLYDYIIRNMTQIYTNSFYVKSSDGSEIYGDILEAPTMVSALLEVVGNTKVLTLTGKNNQIYTVEWSSYTPEGKKFSGLSLKANSKSIIIPVGIETDINLSGEVYFYESYVIYNPILQPFSVNIYKNSAEANRVDKTNYLTLVASLKGVMRDGSSITDLSITFEMDTLPQFNYVYIPALNRYYFVDDIATVKYRLWEMTLTVDVLMTYMDAIYELDAFVTRNEFDWNNNLVDTKRVIEQGYDVETAEVDTTLFDGSGSYVLTGFDLIVDNTGG